MKTMLTCAAVAALLATVGPASAQSPAPASYKATRDFSYNNPGGVWSYGYGTAGDKASFVRYPAGLISAANGLLDSFYDGESSVSVNATGAVALHDPGSSKVVIPTDALVMHPRLDGQETMVVFTAPAHSFYRMEGFFEILDNAPTSVAPRIVIGTKDQTRKAFGEKQTVVLSGAADPAALKPGEKKSFSFTRELSKNQRVQFALNPNGHWRFDSTGFDVTITPVASK
ncbi:hypothetical protein [Chenggangzhangella methanolivorans]|uniref:Uncharacterized protein n=1 Tax=Chenggangzhangella methanolivorans TaxID=1437009 RepID=A0A9E6RG64_9HYPH|nr:hypothetical protein [Chenggangzhangella methanolivorans]QZO00801.1 hypothetical protein K6K41_03795 [Chenggangzhangella methanolivorans]